MRSAAHGDDGSVAAELAVALPAVLLVLLIGVSALGAATVQVALQDAAADAARLLGRGEPVSSAAAVVSRAVDRAQVSTQVRDELACVTARSDVRIGRIISIPVRASSCALAGGL